MNSFLRIYAELIGPQIAGDFSGNYHVVDRTTFRIIVPEAISDNASKSVSVNCAFDFFFRGHKS